MATSSQRRVIPLREAFFCDGAWYVLSSTSLGGSGLTAADIGKCLQSEDPEVMRGLLAAGVCLPLFFPGDCALDDAVIVEGELDEEEQEEWIGRLRSKIEIPCGEFMIMGGGMDEDFEVALANKEAPDPHFVFFQKVDVDPGTYLLEVYAFLSSLTVNDEWEAEPELVGDVESWWASTRGDEPRPEWILFFQEEEYVDGEEFGFLEYLVRLRPLTEEIVPPPLDEDTNWCGVYEVRRPPKCPRGIVRSKYGEVR